MHQASLSIFLMMLFLASGNNTTYAITPDFDADGISDDQETAIYGTDPLKSDTDGDGFSDSQEIKDGYSPLLAEKKKLREVDTDSDGLWDDWEIALGTKIATKDSDGDGFNDGDEVFRSYDPLNILPIKVTKRIEVSLKDQRLAYFFGETQLDELPVSSGLRSTPTPPGEYAILKKRPIVHYIGTDYRYPNTKWNLMFKKGSWGNYYVHGAYWHNKFGQPRSHGCVNVPYTQDAMGRLYDWAEEGTPVIIRTESLGSPETPARRVSVDRFTLLA